MDSGFYSSFTGFATRLDALEVVANNLANTNTPGYKAQLSFYRSMPAWLQQSLTTPLNQAVNQFGVLGGAQLDLSSSNLEKTDNPTDVALQGGGFFNIQTKACVRYTRDGNFQLNAKRQLVTAHGDLVLGDAGPIQIPSGQITIRCQQEPALLLAPRMLGDDAKTNPSVVGDALGELCNMVAGNFKSKISSLADHCMLSVPTVIWGEDYVMQMVQPNSGFQFALSCENQPVWFSLAIHA